MDYSPPPLFKQGASARAKVVVFAMIAIALLVVDSKMRSLTAIRQVVGVGLYPLQVIALLPRDASYAVGGYFSSLSRLQNENGALRREQIVNAQQLQQGQQLLAENAYLRKLLGAGERLPATPIMAEILYDARDAFTRKLVVDRGSRHGVEPGLPVIDDVGVVGQVTRVFPFTSEVSLLTDKDQAIPVQVVRSGLRSVAYGQGHVGSLDLRFMPVNADIKNGDMLVTSGIDGIYPAGLAVAKVTQVESKSSDAFARIVLQPVAGINRNRQLLILLADGSHALSRSNEVAGLSRPDHSWVDDKDPAAPAKPAVAAVKHAPAEQPKPAAPSPQVSAPKMPVAQAAAQPQTPSAAPKAPVTPVQAVQPAPAPKKPAISAPPAAQPQPVPAAPRTPAAPSQAAPASPVAREKQAVEPARPSTPAGQPAKQERQIVGAEVKTNAATTVPALEPKGVQP
ncbi:MAG: rod shape-determining protein MreC [Burkholderiaceae bacterium]